VASLGGRVYSAESRLERARGDSGETKAGVNQVGEFAFEMSIEMNGKPIYVPRDAWRHVAEPKPKFDPAEIAREMRKARAEGKICLSHQTLGEKQEVFNPEEYAPLVKKAIAEGRLIPGAMEVSSDSEPPRAYKLCRALCKICNIEFDYEFKGAARKTCFNGCTSEALRRTARNRAKGVARRDYKRKCVVCAVVFDGTFTQTTCSDVCKQVRDRESNKKSKEKQKLRKL